MLARRRTAALQLGRAPVLAPVLQTASSKATPLVAFTRMHGCGRRMQLCLHWCRPRLNWIPARSCDTTQHRSAIGARETVIRSVRRRRSALSGPSFLPPLTSLLVSY